MSTKIIGHFVKTNSKNTKQNIFKINTIFMGIFFFVARVDDGICCNDWSKCEPAGWLVKALLAVVQKSLTVVEFNDNVSSRVYVTKGT